MTKWLRILQALLPRGESFDIVINKKLRQFFQGLADVFETISTSAQELWSRIIPEDTDELAAWELQFGLNAVNLTEQERRARLLSAWRRQGGQDPKYIQDTLQAAGFDVYVHEWWVPGVLHPYGGSVNGDEPPVARNPYTYLYDGLSPADTVGDGHNFAGDGHDDMQDGNSSIPPGRLLVNKIVEPLYNNIGDGHTLAQDGAIYMLDGGFTLGYSPKLYTLTATPSQYPYFLYIGGETFPNLATIPANERDIFEDLVLKICPLEQWVGLLVQYV